MSDSAVSPESVEVVGGQKSGFSGEKALWFGTTVVVVWAVAALTVPFWAQYSPISDQDIVNRLQAPTSAHWFGTDELGRDVFTRIIYGARLSMPVSVVTVALGMLFGTVVGAIAGFSGGVVDAIFMRICDIFLSFPAIVLALGLAAALGNSSKNVVIAIAVVMWPEYARLVRGQVLSIRNNLHVTAATSIGASRSRIFRVHILPFGLPPVIVKATVDLGMVILLAAGLSFIGVGAAPPTPEWGTMISEAQKHMEQWWLALFPGLAILSLVLAFNFIGDAMRDKFDPQMRAQRRRRWRISIFGKTVRTTIE